MLFSVGAGGGGAGGVVVGVVVVVVVDVSGAFCSPFAHDAVTPTITTIAAPPATAATRRARLNDSMLVPIYWPRD
jgi:hypothetical protein